VEDVSTGNHYISSSDFSITTGNIYSFSLFAKKGDRDWIYVTTQFNASSGVYFNLSTGEVGTVGTAVGNYSITPMADGFYRLEITITSTVTDNRNVQIRLADADGSNSYTGDGTSGVYIFDAQLEENTYASSPILNIVGGVAQEGATVTRVADVANDATYAGDSESGTFWVKMAAWATSGTERTISISDGTADNELRIWIPSGATNSVSAWLIVGGVTQFDFRNIPVDVVTDYNTLAVEWKTNDASFWIDGVKKATDTSVVVPAPNTFNVIKFDRAVGGVNFYGKVLEQGNSEYLSDAEMATLK